MQMFHHTCYHSAPSIEAAGVVIPQRQPLLPGQPYMSWWTDIEHVDGTDAFLLGLTSTFIGCDRLEVTFAAVDDELIVSWRTWRDTIPRTASTAAIFSELEFGRRPSHWWIALKPVAIRKAEPAQ